MFDNDIDNKINKKRNQVSINIESQIQDNDEPNEDIQRNNQAKELISALETILSDESYSHSIALVKIQEYIQLIGENSTQYFEIQHLIRLLSFINIHELCYNSLFTLSLIQSYTNKFTQFFFESYFLDTVANHISEYQKGEIFMICSLLSNIIIDDSRFVEFLLSKDIVRYIIGSPFGGPEKRRLLSLIFLYDNNRDNISALIDVFYQQFLSKMEESDKQEIKFPYIQAISKVLNDQNQNNEKKEFILAYIKENINILMQILILSSQNQEYHICREILQILFFFKDSTIDFTPILTVLPALIQSGNQELSCLSMKFVSLLITLKLEMNQQFINSIIKTNFIVRMKTGGYEFIKEIVSFLAHFLPLTTSAQKQSILFKNNNEEFLMELVEFVPVAESKSDILFVIYYFTSDEKCQNLVIQTLKNSSFFDYIEEVLDLSDDETISQLENSFLEISN